MRIDDELDKLSEKMMMFIASLEPKVVANSSSIALYNTWTNTEEVKIENHELVPALLDIITDYKNKKTDGLVLMNLFMEGRQ